MVGLSVILENCEDLSAKTSFQVVSKGTMVKLSSNPSSPTFSFFNGGFSRDLCAGFLDRCFLCHEKLMPAKDIYMYKGDRAFCSVECRCRQILMDEEETSGAKTGCTIKEYNHCSLAATPSSRSSSRSGGKRSRNRASNAFVY